MYKVNTLNGTGMETEVVTMKRERKTMWMTKATSSPEALTRKMTWRNLAQLLPTASLPSPTGRWAFKPALSSQKRRTLPLYSLPQQDHLRVRARQISIPCDTMDCGDRRIRQARCESGCRSSKLWSIRLTSSPSRCRLVCPLGYRRESASHCTGCTRKKNRLH